MAKLRVAGRILEIDLVVFDKDGTLIDLHSLWGGRTRRCAAWLAAELGGGETLVAALYHALGYDARAQQVLSVGPLATAPRRELLLVTATVLYQHGVVWHRARELARHAFAEIMVALPEAGDLHPVGDIAGLLQRLAAAGIRAAVATSDDRRPTEHTLNLLGVADGIDALVCGDDPLPAKPAPEVLRYLAEALDVTPARIMMVGDTECDMRTGRNAGAGCCVGVLSGAAAADELAGCADVVVASVQEIGTSA